MRRTLKWSASVAALLAIGVSGPANAQAQEFVANTDKARATLTEMIALIDKIDARLKAAAQSTAVQTAAAPGSAKTYTLILTGAQ